MDTIDGGRGYQESYPSFSFLAGDSSRNRSCGICDCVGDDGYCSVSIGCYSVVFVWELEAMEGTLLELGVSSKSRLELILKERSPISIVFNMTLTLNKVFHL